MHPVTPKEAQALLPELVAGAGAGGEIVITQNARPVAKLAVPNAEERPVFLFEILKGKVAHQPGWDEPVDDFRPRWQ